MAIPKVNFEVRQNQTFDHTLVIYDVTEKPLALNGYSAHMQVREDPESTVVLLEFSSITGGIVIGQDSTDSQGQLSLFKAANAISALEASSYSYDLFLISASGRRKPIIAGKFKIIASVTKDA